MGIAISRSLLDRMLALAAATPGREVCGLLLGEGGRIAAIVPAANVAADPARRFELDPAALIAAHRAARGGGPAVLGHYHSHPGGDPTPSAADAEAAAPDGALWLIVADGAARLWRSGGAGLHGRFAAVDLDVDGQAAACIAPDAAIGAVAMANDRIDLAALLCSRLCHDLLSPVGALNNGLELMADESDPQMRERCLDLLGESARTSANKLKFFRLAFGAAGGFGDAVPAAEIEQAIRGMFAGNARLTVGWLVGEETLPKPDAKVLLNLALIGGEALVRGGQLDIGAERHEGVHELVVRAEGLKMVIDADVRRALAGTLAEDAVTSRTAAAWMVRRMVDEAGGTLMLSEPDDPAILFGVRLPDRSLRRAPDAI